MGQSLGLFSNPVETFSREEITFVQQPPDHLDLECPICLHIMAEPHIVSCCGQHFCGECIRQSKKTSNFCPLCKAGGYDIMVDKGLQRMIHGLLVKCIYETHSCPWVGELQNLSSHMGRRKREGECPYAHVSCVNGCGFKNERGKLGDHELHQCLKRIVNCLYCNGTGKHEDITTSHLEVCPDYPIRCPKECKTGLKLPRRQMKEHLQEACPMVDIKCDYQWAGCEWEGFRGDLEIHADRSSSDHLRLVAKVMMSLKEENKQLKKDINEMKTLSKKTITELHKQSNEIDTLKSELLCLRTKQ